MSAPRVANPHANLISDAEQRELTAAGRTTLAATALGSGPYAAIPLDGYETRRTDTGGVDLICTVCWHGYWFAIRAVNDKEHESFAADHRKRHRTIVINLKDDVPYDVYIGRAVPRRGLKASKWGNPYALSAAPSMTRERAIELYRAHLLRSPDLLAALPELKGKVLGCWCKPLACHGDVLAALADAQVVQPAELVPS